MKIIKNLRASARTIVFTSLGLAAVTALAGAALAAPAGHESGETVARWNKNALSVLLPTNPPELTRALAMAAQTPNGAAFIGLSSGANSNLILGNI
jgi:hypothetical protein